jgi:hypothetical protein
MQTVLFQEFSKYEDGLLKKYEQHALFTQIQKLSDKEFLHVLTQYGEGISANFVKFLETAVRQIENAKAQDAIVRILRDEIPVKGPTHQMMRSQACARIGINPAQLAATALTEVTKNTINTYYDVITNSDRKWHNRDLGLTTFVRVIGESLVGVVYRIFTQEIVRRFKVKENEIEFYSFHWHHDEKGGTPFDGGEIGHTEYYDLAMQDLLKTEEDLEEAKKVGDLALEIRCTFQDQFIKS